MDQDGSAPEQPWGGRAVLVRDSRWPVLPGVCCWRHSIKAAFAAIGVPLAHVTWQPLPSAPDVAGRAEAQGDNPVPPQADALPRLAGSTLVIAESFEAATAAVASGALRHRVWVLALPAEELHLGVPSDYAARVADAAHAFGGFLTDSELARESLERAAADSRPRVEIFPPLAMDRACTLCTAAVPTGQGGETPAVCPDEVAQLVLWRSMLDHVRAASVAEEPYSFVAARLRGLSAPWTAAKWPGWGEGCATTPMSCPDDLVSVDWSADAQIRCARAVWQIANPPAQPPRRARRAALVTGFDLKFARDLAERLDSRSDLQVTTDEWPFLSKGSDLTEKLADSAESILAEWARPSAVWLSRRKRRDQILVVRLHRYEIDSPFPREIDIDNVDSVVYIAPQFGRRIRDEIGWPADKLVYIPNFLDVDWLDRPKLPEAQFAIGFVGLELSRKRFDLALDLLSAVRREDRRFTMRVRTAMPWDNKYVWVRSEERQYVGWCLARLERDPFLRGAVIFDPPGRNMASWYRKVGHILSTSDEEGCHTAVAEGMASGAVPIVRPWPGAVEVYDIEWAHASVGDAAAAVLANADPAMWARAAARARAEIRRTNAPELVVQAWADLLHGEVERARGHFAEYSSM